MSELRFEGVSVRYGTGRRAMSAVDGVDLTVPSGQVVGLVGESGSGKSTLARAAVGLAPLAAGRVLLDGKELNRRAGGRGRRPLQMVFQDPYASLDPRMSVGGAVAEAVPKGAFPDAEARRAEVVRLLDLVGLDAGHAAARPGRLSGGQRQRVALARALAARPEVVIADEITSALDVSIQGTVLNLVRELQRGMRLGMLFISHNLAVVRYVSDVLAVMYLGRIVEYGPAAQVLSDPQHPYTRELLAAAPRADARPATSRSASRARPDADAGAETGTETGAGADVDVEAGGYADADARAAQDPPPDAPPADHAPAAGTRPRPPGGARGGDALDAGSAEPAAGDGARDSVPAGVTAGSGGAADRRAAPTAAPSRTAVPVAVLDAEPPDPHHPPAGCRFHPRCPVGPLADPGRTQCLTADPSQDARGRRHSAACHFAAAEPR